MWWLAAKKWLKISAIWCRQHWRWLVVGTAAIVLYYLGRKSAKAQVLSAKMALETYKADKAAIERAHQKEIEDIKKAQETYQKAMAHINQKFSNKTDSLSLQREQKVREMVKKAKKDPVEVDRILEQELGIKKI
jgi:phosphoenolpyruvate carboxylase